MVRLHPYEYVYYNQFIGGLPGAYGKYETDYWAVSYYEATRMLVKYLKDENPKNFSSTKYIVYAEGPDQSASYYFPENLSIRKGHLRWDSEFVVVFTRFNSFKNPAYGKNILTVERFGVPLSFVKDLRKDKPL